jgi:protein O-GlcNAc transferase
MNDHTPAPGGWKVAGPKRAKQISPEQLARDLDAKREQAEHIYLGGNPDLAEQKYRDLINEAPDMAIAHNGLGDVLVALMRFEEALASYDQALLLKPDSAGGHNNRGNVLWDLNRFDDALKSFDTALSLNPQLFEAHNNRANALQSLGRYEEALESLDQALALDPMLVPALNNRGNALKSLDRFEEALESYAQALAINPDLVEAYANRGNILKRLGRQDEALENFAEVHKRKPDTPFNAGAMVRTKMQICDWNALDNDLEILVELVRLGKPAIQPFAFLGLSDRPEDQLQCTETFVRQDCPEAPAPLWQGETYNHDRIRIAYVSADFHDHPMAILMSGLFEGHDRSRFETYAFSFGPDRPGPARTRLEKAFDHFINVPEKTPEEIAQLIRHHEIDIAIDRKGHTRDSRPNIFALRPAPIQAAWLAYPGTFGASYMDYIIADRFVIPEDQQQFYSENVVYLPDSYQANDSKRSISDHTPTRAEVGLPDDGFVFCSFNQNYKILPPMFDIWMRLLKQVEGSVFWLWVGHPKAIENLQKEAAARGVDPKRLVFASRIKHADHLARHRLADLFLDTLPFNAHTTASDALWTGLPVVTCAGTTFAGRVAASLLNAANMPDLITNSLEDYEALALKLATDDAALLEVRDRLKHNLDRCPLFDTDLTRRHVEAAYETMWQKQQAGAPAHGFSVIPVKA